MAASKFFEVLPILRDENAQLGVCAMGPVGDDDDIIWMRVWVWQQDGDNVAASAGNAGDHVPGAHKLDEDEDVPPFTHKKHKQWMVQTKREKESAEFKAEKPALVQAMALVERDGERNIVQWGQAVALRAPGGGHGGHAGPSA
jgi:hypothetical protein